MKILFKSLLLTVVTLLLTFLTSKLSETKSFKIIFPETAALEEFEITDVAFKNRKDPDPNEEIVLVNLGLLDRRDVAQVIEIVARHQPRVIGIDYVFDCPDGLRDTINCPQLRDVKGNEMLEQAIANAGNVVLATRLLRGDESKEYLTDSVRHSDQSFRENSIYEGYNNLETEDALQDGAKTCRQFVPKLSLNGKMNYAFGVQLARAYDSLKAKKFLKRNNFSEIINYKGNVFELSGKSNYPEIYYQLEAADVLTANFIPELMNDRIVILGFAGDPLIRNSWVDKYYTPLNKTITGKATPDMFGLVVHANILSMILEADYVDKLSDFNEFVFAFFVCFLHVYILLIIRSKLPRWFDVVSLSLIFIQLVSYSYLRIFSMQYFSFKLTLIVTLGSLAIASLSINIFSGIFESLLNKRVSLLKHKSHPVEKVIQ